MIDVKTVRSRGFFLYRDVTFATYITSLILVPAKDPAVVQTQCLSPKSENARATVIRASRKTRKKSKKIASEYRLQSPNGEASLKLESRVLIIDIMGAFQNSLSAL